MKTRLIKEALVDASFPVIFYQCSAESYERNLESFSNELKLSLGSPFLFFRSFHEVFSYLSSLNRRIIAVLDEYGEFKKSYGGI